MAKLVASHVAPARRSNERESEWMWTQRTLIALNKLEDPSTREQACTELRQTCNDLAPHELKPFLKRFMDRKHPLQHVLALRDALLFLPYVCERYPEACTANPGIVTSMLQYTVRGLRHSNLHSTVARVVIGMWRAVQLPFQQFVAVFFDQLRGRGSSHPHAHTDGTPAAWLLEKEGSIRVLQHMLEAVTENKEAPLDNGDMEHFVATLMSLVRKHYEMHAGLLILCSQLVALGKLTSEAVYLVELCIMHLSGSSALPDFIDHKQEGPVTLTRELAHASCLLLGHLAKWCSDIVGRPFQLQVESVLSKENLDLFRLTRNNPALRRTIQHASEEWEQIRPAPCPPSPHSPSRYSYRSDDDYSGMANVLTEGLESPKGRIRLPMEKIEGIPEGSELSAQSLEDEASKESLAPSSDSQAKGRDGHDQSAQTSVSNYDQGAETADIGIQNTLNDSLQSSLEDERKVSGRKSRKSSPDRKKSLAECRNSPASNSRKSVDRKSLADSRKSLASNSRKSVDRKDLAECRNSPASNSRKSLASNSRKSLADRRHSISSERRSCQPSNSRKSLADRRKSISSERRNSVVSNRRQSAGLRNSSAEDDRDSLEGDSIGRSVCDSLDADNLDAECIEDPRHRENPHMSETSGSNLDDYKPVKVAWFGDRGYFPRSPTVRSPSPSPSSSSTPRNSSPIVCRIGKRASQTVASTAATRAPAPQAPYLESAITYLKDARLDLALECVFRLGTEQTLIHVLSRARTSEARQLPARSAEYLSQLLLQIVLRESSRRLDSDREQLLTLTLSWMEVLLGCPIVADVIHSPETHSRWRRALFRLSGHAHVGGMASRLYHATE